MEKPIPDTAYMHDRELKGFQYMKGNILKWNTNGVLDDQTNHLFKYKKSHFRELRNVSCFDSSCPTTTSTRLIQYTFHFYTNIKFLCLVLVTIKKGFADELERI